MNFQGNVEVKAREAQLYRLLIYIDFEWNHRSVKSVGHNGHATGAKLVGWYC